MEDSVKLAYDYTKEKMPAIRKRFRWQAVILADGYHIILCLSFLRRLLCDIHEPALKDYLWCGLHPTEQPEAPLEQHPFHPLQSAPAPGGKPSYIYFFHKFYHLLFKNYFCSSHTGSSHSKEHRNTYDTHDPSRRRGSCSAGSQAKVVAQGLHQPACQAH